MEFGNDNAGLVSVELWSQLELWQVEFVQPGELLRLWLAIELLYAGLSIALANEVLAFWWQ